MLSPLPSPSETAIPEMRAAQLEACRRHLHVHGRSLANALGHVAGDPGAGQVWRLIDDIRHAREWRPAFARRLERLLSLLRLEHLDDDDALFPVPAGLLDPEAPEVEACCWHADRLEDLVESAAEISRRIAALPRREGVRAPVRA